MLTCPSKFLIQVPHWTVMTLWAFFDKEISKINQLSIVNKIKRQVCVTDIRLESGRINPVEKDLLVVAGCEGNLLIDEIPEENNPVVIGAHLSNFD